MNPAPGSARPATVTDALLQLADWLDEADRLIDTLAAARGRERSNRGDEVQQDLRGLAAWFARHPAEAAASWSYVTGEAIAVPAVRDRREPGDPEWTATELLGVTPAQERTVRAVLARHFRVLASAVNVADWPAYIRSVADAHDAGTAWLDRAYRAADACPDDPDGLHHSGCGCDDVDPLNPN